MKEIEKLVNLKERLVLASKSPRRSLLLKNLGFDFDVFPSEYKEDKIDTHDNYPKYVEMSAYYKAEDVYRRIGHECVILAADTIVVLNNKILHKPKNEKEAIRTLKKLSNKTHTVYTGICLINTLRRNYYMASQSTEVTFRKLEEDEIKAYVATGSPMDKAGAYGIQDDFGAVFVSNIKGCYYNIVGLPLELLYQSMREYLKVTY